MCLEILPSAKEELQYYQRNVRSKEYIKATCLLILFSLYTFPLFSQSPESFSVSGYVKDIETGETLIGSHIVDSAVTANSFGFFSIVRQTGEATTVSDCRLQLFAKSQEKRVRQPYRRLFDKYPHWL